MNPAASAFPAACCRTSEQIMFKIPSLGIEDSPEIFPEGFNLAAEPGKGAGYE